MAETPAARQARLKAKRRAEGLTQVVHWIPNTKQAKDAMKALAAKLRGEK